VFVAFQYLAEASATAATIRRSFRGCTLAYVVAQFQQKNVRENKRASGQELGIDELNRKRRIERASALLLGGHVAYVVPQSNHGF
jgi:hypothetical protein